MTSEKHLRAYREELLKEQKEEIAAINRKYAVKLAKLAELLEAPTDPQSSAGAILSPQEIGAKTLPAAVREGIGHLSGIMGGMSGNFTSVTVYNYIKEHYPTLLGDKKPGHISAPLWVLKKDGEIEVVTEGSGRSPAIYRKTAKFDLKNAMRA